MRDNEIFYGLRDDRGNGEQICAGSFADAMLIARQMAAPGVTIRVAEQDEDGSETGLVDFVVG